MKVAAQGVLDTRGKILAGAACVERLAACAAAGTPVTLVSGVFDPVLAAHTARLRSARPRSGLLAVVILDPPDPILPARARAELVAALACVDLVFLPEGVELPAPALDLSGQDLSTRQEFIEHVRRRQS